MVAEAFFFALVDLSVKAQVHGDGGAKINELIHHLHDVVVNAD